MQSNLTELTVQQLRYRLDAAKQKLADSLVEACQIILELERRREILPDWTRRGAFKYRVAISEGRLHPELALLDEREDVLRTYLKLPIEQQERFAQGGKVQVLRYDGDEEVVYTVRPHQLDAATLDRVFGDEGVRSISEQRKIYLKQQQAEAEENARRGVSKVGRYTVLVKERRFKVGNAAVEISDLPDILKPFGLYITAEPPAKRQRAA